MFMIWFIGFLSILAYRVFNAGMKTKTLFYRVSPYYGDGGKMIFNDGAAGSYALYTFLIALTWMISLPIIGIFMLGKRFNKES